MVKVFRSRIPNKRRSPRHRAGTSLADAVQESIEPNQCPPSDSRVDGDNQNNGSLQVTTGRSDFGTMSPAHDSPPQNADERNELASASAILATANDASPLIESTHNRDQNPEEVTALLIPQAELQANYNLQESLALWFKSFDALAKSPQMSDFVVSTRRLAGSTGRAIMHVALFPVTAPLQAVKSTTTLAIKVTDGVLERFFVENRTGCETEERSGARRKPSEGLVYHALDFVPSIFRTVDEIGSAAASLISPVWAQRRIESGDRTEREGDAKKYGMKSGETCEERDVFLQRFQILPSASAASAPKMSSAEGIRTEDDCLDRTGWSPKPSLSDFSKYLLRVDDIRVMSNHDPAVENQKILSFIDLGKEFGDEDLTLQALRLLICRAKATMWSNEHTRCALPSEPESIDSFSIDWSPEGNTSTAIRDTAKMLRKEQCEYLESNVLVWSGIYRGPKYFGSSNPFFMARGVIPMSPREMLEMMWDSQRSKEYNNWSLGRSDAIIIEDDIPNGGSFGAKVVTSETKVPFTSFSIRLTVLMHAVALNDDPNEGYIVVSRSVATGMAGCHTEGSIYVESGSKNEILLGVNIMRPVPGQGCDLSSLSQVRSAMVPSFLERKIGLMGISDFFETVRSRPKREPCAMAKQTL